RSDGTAETGSAQSLLGTGNRLGVVRASCLCRHDCETRRQYSGTTALNIIWGGENGGSAGEGSKAEKAAAFQCNDCFCLPVFLCLYDRCSLCVCSALPHFLPGDGLWRHHTACRTIFGYHPRQD